VQKSKRHSSCPWFIAEAEGQPAVGDLVNRMQRADILIITAIKA
jgi:hypothetical protein